MNELNISGACSLNSEEIFKGDELKIDMGGAGIIDLEVDIKELKLFISGAGAVKLAGNVDRQQIDMSGAGGYEASDLVSKFCEINISGVGNADIYVLEKLQATISGLGGINYKGKPEVIESDVSGLGVIQCTT